MILVAQLASPHPALILAQLHQKKSKAAELSFKMF